MKLKPSKPLARRLSALAGAGLLAAGLAVLGPAGSASAGASNICYGYTCHGHDPVIFGCPASSTVTVPVKYNGTQVATLYNRYSSYCNANWGRAQLSTAGYAAHDSFLVEVDTTDSLGHYEFMCYPGPANTGHLTEPCTGTYAGNLAAYCDMVDGTHSTTAAVQVFDSTGRLLTTAFASQ